MCLLGLTDAMEGGHETHRLAASYDQFETVSSLYSRYTPTRFLHVLFGLLAASRPTLRCADVSLPRH